MTDHDTRVSKRYAELAREEPGAAIDAAILAASKRPLARDSWSRRWGAPVSIAAVLVLAVGVTLRMQYEQPGVEQPDAPRAGSAPPVAQAAPKEEVRAPEPRAKAAPESTTPTPAPASRDDFARAPRKARAPEMKQKLESYSAPKPFAESNALRAREETGMASDKKDLNQNAATSPPAASPAAPATPPAAAASAPSPAPAQAQSRMQGAPLRMQAAPALAEEEVELERIAKLRAEGRDQEADKALEEFRRKYPVYRIPEATWARVKPR
jgi:hypothetical protein